MTATSHSGVIPVGGGFGGPEQTRRIGSLLVNGGLPIIEFTLRRPTALDELEDIRPRVSRA